MTILVKDDSSDSDGGGSANVLFRWHHGGNSTVSVSIGEDLVKTTALSVERDVFGRGRLFSGTVRLPYGKHLFRFLVDGTWRHDPQLMVERDKSTGELWNFVHVSSESPFRLQLPQKNGPDDSAEAMDLINSLREFNLRTPRSSSRSRRDRSGAPAPLSTSGSSGSLPLTPPPPPPPPPPSSCTSPVRPVDPPTPSTTGAINAVLRPVVLASFKPSSRDDEGWGGEATSAAGCDGSWRDEEAESTEVKLLSGQSGAGGNGSAEGVDERCYSGGIGGEAVVNGGEASDTGDESRRMEEVGVDLEDMGIGEKRRGSRLQQLGQHVRERSDNGNGSAGAAGGIPGLWDFVPDNAAAAAAASETYRTQEASAAVGACLVTSSVRKDGKLLVAMVGLPARGKTFVARAIARHLDWTGLRCRIFSVGQHRRKEVGVRQPTAFFEPGGEGEKTRKRMASEVLHEALEALREDIDIAIYDSSNVTSQRRKWLADAVASSGLHAQVVFIEAICKNEELVRQNIAEVKRTSPEYQEVGKEEAERQLKDRIHEYERVYQPVEASEGYRFIKLIDVGSQMVTNLISGYIPGRITMLCLNLHLYPRPIWMSRHGESEFNMQGRIGGDAPLTSSGKFYASKLTEFMNRLYPPASSGIEGTGHGKGGGGDQELVVWTSTMLRTGQTVAPMTKYREVIKWSQLTEINAGLMDSLTYENVAEQMPEEYEARKRDKLRYRYPGGESYQDLFIRLEPLIFEMLRQRSPLLVVGHQAILRVLYGYLTGKRPEECPTLQMPLHTVIKLTPKAYECEEEWHLPLEEYVDGTPGTDHRA